MTEDTYPHDPAYGPGVEISMSTEDLLPMTALVRVLERHSWTDSLVPDDMVEHLLAAVVSCGSVKADYQLTIEQQRAMGPADRRRALRRMLDEMSQATAMAYWRHGNPDGGQKNS